jgi:hypothetical protein
MQFGRWRWVGAAVVLGLAAAAGACTGAPEQPSSTGMTVPTLPLQVGSTVLRIPDQPPLPDPSFAPVTANAIPTGSTSPAGSLAVCRGLPDAASIADSLGVGIEDVQAPIDRAGACVVALGVPQPSTSTDVSTPAPAPANDADNVTFLKLTDGLEVQGYLQAQDGPGTGELAPGGPQGSLIGNDGSVYLQLGGTVYAVQVAVSTASDTQRRDSAATLLVAWIEIVAG